MSRAGPDQSAILHLAGPGFFLVLVCLHEDLADLLEGLDGTGIRAAVHLVVPLAEQLVAGAEQLRIGALVDFPLLQLVLGLLVEALDLGEVRVPVPLRSGLFLDELYAGLDVLCAHLHGFLVQIADREAEMEHGNVGEAAAVVRGSHGGAVAGHGGGEEACAHMRQSVDDQCAALGRGHGAAVSGQAEGLNSVYVGHAGQLVDLRDQEHCQQLVGEAVQIGEAGHDLTHGHLIKQDGPLVESFAVAVLLIALCGEHKVLGNVTEHIIYEQMAHAQVASAQAHDVLVHEAVAAEVGDHPAIVKGGVECGDEVLGEGAEQHGPHAGPLVEVICGVLYTAPLTANGSHSALAVEAAETALTVKDDVLLVLRIEGHESLELVLDAGRVGLCVFNAVLTELLPVGGLEKIPGNTAELLKVFPLSLPVDLVFAPEELRIRILYLFLLSHYALPSSLWMRLISRDSTKAWTRVRS